MSTRDELERIQRMKEELRILIEKRNDARSKDAYLFRWYAERAIKLEMDIRQAV